MRRFTDEEIMAYADGEATPEQARAIAEAARNDPVLASRVSQFEETRRVLKEAFARSLSEPVPERLRNLLKGNAENRGQTTINTGDERNKRGLSPIITAAPAANAPAWVPMALAASVTLAIGLAVGDWLGKRGGGAAPATEMVASAAIDAGTLARALETSASGVAVAAEIGGRQYEVLPASTLKTADGAYCREFEASVVDTSGRRDARGLACRHGNGQWATQAIAAMTDTSAPAGGYRTASGGSMDFASALGAERLTPEQESAAIGNGWKHAQ